MFRAKYYIEDIYELVGREDRVATLTFFPDSESFKLYGNHITVVFLYSQKERFDLDEKGKNKNTKTADYAKVKYLGNSLQDEIIVHLNKRGIYCEDIASILTLPGFERNLFHSDEKRKIMTHTINMHTQSKGGDFDWMYGFTKRQVQEGIGICPYERNFYLAAKYYYEPQNITEEEKLEMLEGSQLKESIEWEYLTIKYHREDINTEENKRLVELYFKKKQFCKDILEKYLNESGSSIKKVAAENIELAVDLMERVLHFRERRLNVGSKYPIYLDLDGYLHIFMRHVEEMKVNKHFEHKDNFQWDLDDVMSVIKYVIENVNEEFQDFVRNNKGNQFKKYGDQSIYFEGDYYAVYIASNGRLESLFKIKKDLK